MAEIVIDRLRKTFGDFTAVASSSFRVENGEFFMLLGPSGCGKTTTLRMIAGLELPTSGTISIDGEDVTQRTAAHRDIAFVFQMYALYPHMNVRRNISYPLISQGMKRAEVRQRVDQVARILRIGDLLDRPVSGLSGGDRQRVALGRAIVREPKAFMMDEPLGALDTEFREHMANELRALHDRMNATTVYVTHDQLEAMQMGDKIVVMNQGRIEQYGPPQTIYDKPASVFVADFIGSPAMNLLALEADLDPGARSLTLGDECLEVPELRESAHGDLLLGVRPEHITLSDEGAFRGRVLTSEYLGTTQIVTLTTPNGECKVRLSAEQSVHNDELYALRFNPATITLFDRASGKAIRSQLNDDVLKDLRHEDLSSDG